MTSLSYKTNFFPTFIAILENPVEKFFLQSPKNWDFYFPSERLISVREVQMYKMYFLKEKNAFTKEIFTLSIKVYEYILEYNANFCSYYVCIIFFSCIWFLFDTNTRICCFWQKMKIKPRSQLKWPPSDPKVTPKSPLRPNILVDFSWF